MRHRRSAADHVPQPLGAARLDELALAYVARFATTRAKLARYLARKIRERGWAGEEDAASTVDRIVARMTDLGFVDDAGFAVMRSGAMTRRGLGVRRVQTQLWVDGVAPDDASGALAEAGDQAFAAATAFAKRKRLGPFAREASADPKQRERQLASFVRAGHPPALGRRIIALAPGDEAGLAALDENAVGD